MMVLDYRLLSVQWRDTSLARNALDSVFSESSNHGQHYVCKLTMDVSDVSDIDHAACIEVARFRIGIY